ncbi:MAG: hypothetical protein LBI29_01235, partial [Rickettsiales bacterium]|nr:hypothetical protein [Rickettsiales bacterium]
MKFLNKKISAEEMKSIGELARLVAIMISSVNLEFDRRDHTAEPTPHITRLRELLRDMHQGFRDLDWLDDFILEIGLACHELVICTVANFDDFILTIGSVERLYSSTYEAYKNFVKIGKRDVPDLFDMLASSLKSIIESILSENAMSDEERIRLVEMSRASSKSLSSARLLSNKNATDGEKYMKKLAETSRASSKPLLSTKLPSSVNLNDVVSHSPAKPEENDWRKNIREETKKKLAELEKKFRDRKKEKEDDKLIELDVTRNKRSKETVLKLINVIICVLVRENLEWSHISTYVYANSGFERMTTCAPIVHRIVYFISAIKIMLSKLDVAPRTGTEPDGTGQNADSSGFGTEATFRQKLAGINSDFGKLMDSLDELNNMIWANSPTLSNPLAALNNFLHSLFLIFCSISELDEHLAYSKRKYLSNVLRFYMLFAMKYLYRNGNATSFSENFLKLIGQKIGMEHVKIVLGDLFIGYLDTENLDIASHGLNIEALPVPLDTLGPLCAENIRDRILRFLGNVLKIEPMAYEILNLELFAQSIEHLISLLKNNPLTSNDIFNSRFHALLKSYILDSNDTLDWLEKLIFEIDDMCVEMEKCPARVPYGNMPEILDVRQSVLAMNQIFIDYYYEGRPESVSPPRKPINGLNLFILHTFLRMYKKTYGRQLPMMLTPKELLDLKGQLNSVSQSVGEPTLSGMKFAEKAKEPNSVGKTKAGPASANHKSPSAARKESEISKNLKRCTAFLERTENRVFSILSSIFIKSHGEQKLRTIAKIIMDEFEFVVSYLLDPKTIPGKSTEELEVISKLSFEVMWLLEKVDGGKSEFGHGELGPLIHWLSYVYTSLLGSEGEILQKDYLRNGLLQVLIFSIDSLGMTPGFRLEWVENIAHLFYSTMIANRMGRKFLSKDQITILLTIGEQRPSIFFGESGQILSISTESGKKSKRKKKDKNPEVTDLSGIGDTGTEKTSGVRSEIDLERIRLKILDLIYHILFVRQIMSYDHIGYDALATSIVLLIAAIEPELPESTKNPERHYRNDTLATPIVFLGSAVKIKSLEPAQNSRPTAKIWEETGHGGIFGTPIWAHIVAMLDIFGKINIVTTDKALNSEFKLKKLINILGTTAKAIERMDINPKSRIVQKYKVNMFSLYLKFVGKYLELGGASDIQLEYTDLDIPSEVGSSVALNPLSRFSGASMLKFVMENLSKNPTLNITIMEGRKIRRFVELLATLVYKLESSLSLFDINLYFCFSSILKNTFPNSDDLNWLKKFIYILGLFMSKNTECMNNLSKILGSVSITNPEWLTTKVIDDFSSAGTNDTYGSKEEETDLMTLLRIISVNYAIFSLRYLSEAPSWILILGPKSGYKRSLEVLNLVEERRGFFIHTDLRKEFLDMKRQFQVASRDKENSKIEKDKIAKIKDELRLDIINRFISKGKIPHILYDDDVESTVNPVVDELFYIRKTLYGLEPIKPIIDTEIAKIVEEVDIIINLYLNTSSLSGSNRNGLKGIITWLSSICLNIRDKLSTSINVLLIDKLYEYHMKTLTSYAFFVQNNLDSEVLEWLTSSFKVLFKANMGLSTEDNELTKLCSLLKKGGSGWSSVMESEPIHNILVRDTQTLKIYMLNLFQKILPNDFKTKASDKDVDYMGKFLDDIIAELSNMNEIIKYCGKIALADPKKSPKYTEKALNVHEWFVLYAGMLNIGSNRPEFDDIVYWIFEFATELLEGSDSVSTGIFVKLLIKIESSYSSLITKYNLHRPVWMDEVASILESDGLITNEDTASLGVEVYSYSYSGFFGKKNVRRTLERFFNKNTEGKTVSLEKLSRIIGKFTDSVVCLVSIMKTSRVTERDSSALVRFYSILKNRTPSSSNLEWLFGLVQDIVLFRKQFNFSVEIRSLVFDFCQQCIVPILGHWTDPEWILTLERGDILHVDSMNSINLTLKKHKVLVRILQTVLKSSTEQFDTDEQLDSGEKTHKHEKGLGEERMELQEEELAEKGRENDEKKGAEENRKKEEEKKEEEKKKKEKEERKERRKEKNKNREKIDEEEIEEM